MGSSARYALSTAPLAVTQGHVVARDSMNGWYRTALDDDRPLAHHLAHTLAHDEPPTIWVLIEDSDYGAIGVRDRADKAIVVINREAALDYRDGSQAVELSHDSLALSIDRIAAWGSRNAPRTPTVDELLAAATSEAVYAEDVVESVLALLGLTTASSPAAPKFGGALRTRDSGKITMDGSLVDLEQIGFVLGEGDGFVGIWDRRAPAAPVEVFPPSPDGLEAAARRWRTLNRLVDRTT
jgi:hypothetical protein